MMECSPNPNQMGDETFCINYIDVASIEHLLNLDAKVFSPKDRIDYETTRKRLEINPETDIAVWDGDQLMGYASLYPITHEVYKEIASGTFNESNVEEQTLPYNRIGEYDAYWCGIVIDKENYPRFKSSYLIRAVQNHLARLKKRGVFIRRIIVNTVSIAGYKTFIRLGFKEIKPNILMYDCFKKGIVLIRESFSYPRVLIITHPKMVDV